MLNAKAFALAAGMLWGGGLFVATIWLLALGHQGQLISALGNFYIGYTFSIAGAFVGLIWGFVDGLIGGAIFAWLYNQLAKRFTG